MITIVYKIFLLVKSSFYIRYSFGLCLVRNKSLTFKKYLLQGQYQDHKSCIVKCFWIKLKVSEYSSFAFAIFLAIVCIAENILVFEFCVWVCSVLQLYPILCYPMDCSWPGFSVHCIFQARRLEWVAISYSREFSPPRVRTHISCIADGFFCTTWDAFLTNKNHLN